MALRLLSAAFFVWSLVSVGQIALAQEPASTARNEATCVPTFHCLSIYWSPEDGQAGKKVLVKFRALAEKTWHDALPLRYNPVKSSECKGSYRGSIVNLKPGTAYEIALTLEGTDIHTSLKAATWSETFPAGATVKCQSGAATLTVKNLGHRKA